MTNFDYLQEKSVDQLKSIYADASFHGGVRVIMVKVLDELERREDLGDPEAQDAMNIAREAGVRA